MSQTYYVRVLLDNGTIKNVVVEANDGEGVWDIFKEINEQNDFNHYRRIENIVYMEKFCNKKLIKYQYTNELTKKQVSGIIKNKKPLKSFKDWKNHKHKLYLEKFDVVDDRYWDNINDKSLYIITLLGFQLTLWPFLWMRLKAFLNFIYKNFSLGMQVVSLSGLFLLYFLIVVSKKTKVKTNFLFLFFIVLLFIFELVIPGQKRNGMIFKVGNFTIIYLILLTFIPAAIQMGKHIREEIKNIDDGKSRIQTILLILTFIISLIALFKKN